MTNEIAELRKKVAAAIFDPGNHGEGYKGERSLTEWQTDAVMRVLADLATPDDGWRTYQQRVADAHVLLFSEDPTDIPERRARFFEEANEACQAFGMTEDEAIALVRYTYSRPVGDPEKEVGAAALTLASICVEAGLDLKKCAEADLEKLVRPETIARIKAKRSTRHGRGPLPGFDPAPPANGRGE